ALIRNGRSEAEGATLALENVSSPFPTGLLRDLPACLDRSLGGQISGREFRSGNERHHRARPIFLWKFFVAAAETPEFIAEEALGCRVLVHGGPGGEVARVVGADMAVAIEAGDGVVEDVAVQVERLRVFERGVGYRFWGFGPIGGEEAAELGGVVAGAETIHATATPGDCSVRSASRIHRHRQGSIGTCNWPMLAPC